MGHVCGKQNTVVTQNYNENISNNYQNRQNGQDYDDIFKILLVGDYDTGKSCLMNKYFHDTFDSDYLPTIGVNVSSGMLNVHNSNVKLQVWDTSGQERFRNITSAYYRGARGILLLYDVTNIETFEHLPMWLDTISHYAASDIEVIIVGNKTDADNRVVTEEQAKAFADSVKAAYVEISCKNGTNVKDTFTQLTGSILDKTPAAGQPVRNALHQRQPFKDIPPKDPSWKDTSAKQVIRHLDATAAHSNEKAESFDHLFKLLLVGDAQTGKSSILSKFSNQTFSESYMPTIGIDFTTRTGKVGDSGVKLQIWDTAGQERFRTITQSYYRGAQGIILVYDVTDAETFHNLTYWLAEVKRLAADSVITAIVGNKCEAAERAVSVEEAQGLADSEKASYVEVSCKDGTNVNKLFTQIAGSLLEKTGKEVPGKAWWKTPDAGWH